MTARAELGIVQAPQIDSALAEPGLSFDDAFRRFAPYVARVGMRILGHGDELDDLVQDVFLAAHRGLWRLRDAGAMKGWLATVTVRLARRRLRARKVRAFFGLGNPVETERAVDTRAAPDECALLASIYRILEGVPTERRIAWVLHRIEGEPLEQVARMCGCSLATAKRRIAATQETIQAAVSHA